MKKLIAVALIAFTAHANAGLGSAVATADWPTKPSTKYKLDMFGFDARVYEFTTDNGMKCVAVYSGGNQGGFQMQCVPVEKK